MEKVFIYCLEKNGIVFYVGRSFDIGNRYVNHKNKYGKDIEIVILHETNNSECSFWEAHYVWVYRCWGFNLNNKHLFTTKNYFNKKKNNPYPPKRVYNNAYNKKMAKKWLKENKPFKNKL